MSNVPSVFCSTRKLFLLVKYIFISIPLIRDAVGLKMVYFSCFFICCKVNNYFCNRKIKSRLFSNKMYFYCFLSLNIHFCADFTNLFPVPNVFVSFASFVVLRISLKKIRSIRQIRCEHILDVSLKFNMRPRRTIQHSTFNTQHSYCRPSRSSNLVPRLAVVGGVLLAILTDRSSLKQKYFRLWCMFPPMESNHRKAMPGAGWSRGDFSATL